MIFFYEYLDAPHLNKTYNYLLPYVCSCLFYVFVHVWKNCKMYFRIKKNQKNTIYFFCDVITLIIKSRMSTRYIL